MKFKNYKNIISDSDINMTGLYGDKTLHTILKSLEEDIDELKRNVKFLYQYGGVGSHSGGGSDSSGFSVYATLNKVQITSGNIISLNGNGNYSLLIMINKPRGLSYKVTYTYWNSRSSQDGTTFSETLDMSKSYMLSTILNLDMNGQIRIDCISELGERANLLNANYITSPYTFKVYLGDNEGRIFNVNDNELLINSVANSGLYAYIDYDIGIQGTVSYSYNKLNSSKTIVFESKLDIDLSESSNGSIKLEICPDGFLIDDNAGYYTININISVTPLGLSEVIIPKVINLNLIPNSLYLKISPNNKEASLYDNYSILEPYAFSIGSIIFDLKIYEGYTNSGNSYKVVPRIKHINESGSIISQVEFTEIWAEERKSFSTQNLSTSYSGWNMVEFTVTSNSTGNSITTSKYFFVEQSNLDLNWNYFYSMNSNNNLHYGINGGSFGTSEFIDIFNSNKLLDLSESTSVKTVNIRDDRMNNYSSGEALINIGILYSSINDVNKPILEIKYSNDEDENTNELNDIKIYLKKIDIGPSYMQNGETVLKGVEIFLQKEDNINSSDNSKYHLLTLYRKYYNEIASEPRYEFLVYLDGVLEGALSIIESTSVLFKKIVFNNVRFSINLFDILYFPYNSSVETNNFFTDADISKYWYTYNLYYSTGRYSTEKLKFLLDISNLTHKFKLNSPSIIDPSVNTKMVEVDSDTLSNLIKVLGLAPILLFDVVDTAEYSDPNSDYSNNFLKWYLIPQEQGIDVTGKKPVSVSFKGQDLTTFDVISDSSHRYSFYIEKQGTSTLRNFAKNLNLIVESNVENTDCLFSPNFEDVLQTDSEEEKIRKYNTFLPELKFTLKKDVVDSAHANNNSIADFVNTNTTKFATNDLGKYSPYVKNCLTGFPCLIFVRVSYYHLPTRQDFSTIYYLGYYNFNLGRDSNYNLGYNETTNFNGINNLTDGGTGLSNGFKVYQINSSINKMKLGIMISEIQENTPYYDFSQYDSTILFGAGPSDNFPMLGDEKYSSEIELSEYLSKLLSFIKNISLSGGYIFNYLKKNFGLQKEEYYKTITLTKEDEETGNLIHYISSNNLVPDYRILYERRFDNKDFDFFDKGNEFPEGTYYILDKVLNGVTDAEEDIPPLLNYTSLVLYYVIIMAFGMTDSILKNLNMKSWNNGDTFNIAFYDMDTALGVDNAGHEVTYFAFSDYYDIPPDEVQEGLASLLKKAIVYRDFAFLGTGSYDIPSSYLFAIAKYAKLILKNSLSSQLFPLEYWAKLRSNELLNADAFMNKYYKNRKSNVGEALMNYNYRATYFIEDKIDDSLVYSSENFKQFHGARENRVRNWLNDRLHILDVYMGLVSISQTHRYIEYLNSNHEWETVTYGNEPLEELETLNKPINNPDVIVFKDIFSTTGASYFSLNISAKIKALENSFTVITVPGQNPRYYLIKDPTKLYRLDINISGSQNVSIGGSDRWIYVDNLAPFAKENQLYINSNNLLEFNISGTKTISVVNITGHLPAVRKINIYGLNNTFNLNIGNNADFPNILSIILLKCKVSIEINSSLITSFCARGILSSHIRILNCNYLNDIVIGNLVEELDGNSITTPTNLTLLKITPLYGNFITENINIKEINISANGDNRKLSIKNNITLEKLVISGFSSIELDNCPNLYDIKITGNSTIENFKITNCGKNSGVSPLKINYNEGEEYNVNLSSFTITGEVSFSNTYNLFSINLPNCKLSSSAFYNTSLTKLHALNDKSIIITGPNTFYSCPLVSGLLYLTIDSRCTDLSSTFSSGGTNDGKLPLGEITTFLENIPDLNSITNINNLFGWQKSFVYNITNNFNGELNATNCKLSLRKFNKVTSAVGIFVGTNLEYLNRYIFSGLGKDNDNNGKVNLSDSLNVNSSKLYCTIDSLYDIIGKTDSLNLFIGVHNNDLSNIGLTNRELVLIDNDGLVLTDSLARNINIIDFFRKDNNSTVEFKDIYNVQFSLEFNYYLFFAKPDESDVGLYIVNWPNLKLIYNCFDKIYSKFDNNLESFKTLNLNKLPNLNYIFNSFNLINSSDYIDLINLVNWNNFKNATNSNVSFNITGFNSLRTSDLSGRLLYNSFRNIKKYINKSDYDLINSKFTSCSYYTKFGNIFENTLLITNDEEGFIPNDINTYCKLLHDTFSKAKIIKKSSLSGNYDDSWYSSLLDDDFIPLNIDNIILKYPNCVVFNGTFSEITIYKALPINFFKRRKIKLSSIYLIDLNTLLLLEDDGHYILGKLIQYVYNSVSNNLISNLTRCFYKTKISEDSYQYFDKENFSDFNSIPKNHIEDLDGNILSHTKYKSNIQSSTQTIPLNYEISDCSGVKVRYDKFTYASFDDIFNYSNIILKDFDKDGEYDNKLFIAPDIFYGCSSSCNITECFAECNFAGALPEHLFNPFNNSVPTIKNWINKVNILPRFLSEGTMTYNLMTPLDSEDQRTKENYIFVPSNFGNITNYDYGFTFNLRIPPKFDITDELHLSVIAYYIFNKNSLSNKTASIENALPVYIEPFINSSDNSTGDTLNTRKSYFVNPGNIYFNIMCNDDNNNDGFSLNKVNVSNLFTGPYTKVGYGRLFYGNVNWNNYSNTSGKTVITFNEGNSNSGRYLKHIFPGLPNNLDIKKYITNKGSALGTSGEQTTVHKNLIISGSNKYSDVNINVIGL